MESFRSTQKNSFKKTGDMFYMIAFKFPRDVDDDDDDDDKSVTSNKPSNLKWKNVTIDSGWWNSSTGT
jgi:hypothetical protein